jgi:adenylate cyclase
MEPAGPGRVERRLAAILAADVAGYSRLIEADEEETLGRLKALRAKLIDPKIAGHRGRIVKTTGDGILAEFASVVDALRCAVEVQTAMAESNAPLPPDRRIAFRIGINVGDIVVEDGDIFGDGVNVAARLEGLAEPAASASRPAFRRMRRAASTSASKTWGSSRSRTSRGRSGRTAWWRPPAQRPRGRAPAIPFPTSHR